MSKKKILLGCTLLYGLFLFYLAFVNILGPTDVGIARNWITGELWLQGPGGVHFTSPWVAVASVDTRPTRVCITSASRAFNCKLVRFKPETYREFVATEGFRYYWWSNRISFNWGHPETYRGMRDILRGYAYSVEPYPFITVVEDYEDPP